MRANHLTESVLLKKAEDLHDQVRATHFAYVIWKIAQTYSRKLEEAQDSLSHNRKMTVAAMHMAEKNV